MRSPAAPIAWRYSSQDHFHGRVGQHQLAQVTFMGRAPTALALGAVTVPQEEAFEAMTRPAPIIDRVGPGAAEIADRFVGWLRDIDRAQLPGAQEPGQLAGVAPVGLDPVARTGRSHRGGHHVAFHSELTEPPGQPKTRTAPLRSRPAG
jgi:hypothetical protein